ncbi:DMT family transporter [Anaerostipes sp.]|uniref:DMT family transporter n=1 Tax=Anaerostipes sp. TaxID=1872530 RepID=UPI00258FF7E0|nr:DMT family transporter [Anaerostipes sp.]MCI5624061.1 DMT family transporter [Anaerostipes sp.]MDY2725607.1 DMT family transporter [Anaerostipes faecalis]
MKKQQIRNSFLLLLTAVIWGNAFVAQSVGMNYVGPFTFNSIRCFIGGLVLIPCIGFLEKQERDTAGISKLENRKMLILGGVSCGIALAAGSSFQQFGILHTTVGKAGFITAFYIIIVPILGLFLKKKCGPFVWLGVVIALAGLYFLCITESFSIGQGDIYVFICAIMFSLHILVIDYFIQFVDGVKMSCIQFIVCGIVCAVPMMIFEHPSIGALVAAWKPLLYAGVLSCGVGYTLQIVGQKGMNPTVASLILSLESVTSVIAGFLILHQKLSGREMFGCLLMFVAIILAQIPAGSVRKKDNIAIKNDILC